MKKILLGLGSLSLVFGSVAVVLSCSGDQDISKVLVGEKSVDGKELINILEENKNVFLYTSHPEHPKLENYEEFLNSITEDGENTEDVEEEHTKNIIDFLKNNDYKYKIIEVSNKVGKSRIDIIKEKYKKEFTDKNKSWNMKKDKNLLIFLIDKKDYVFYR